MRRAIAWAVPVAGVAAAAALVMWASAESRQEAALEEARESSIGRAVQITRNAAGEAVIHLDREAQEHAGLEVGEAAPAEIRPRLTAYGRLEADPAAGFIVRSPVAGTLLESSGKAWPQLGQRFADGAALAAVEPRLSGIERLGLMEKLSQARAEAAASAASLDAAKLAYERARKLNADNKNVSDRALQEAEARLKAEEARARSAGETVRAIESFLGLAPDSAQRISLIAERGGEIVEVTGRPGELVEPGQAVLKLARYETLLARVSLPAGESIASPGAARITASGFEHLPLAGTRVALATNTDPGVQGQSFLYRVPNPGLALRPGLAVTAAIETNGEARAGVRVPGSALLRSEGRTWAYVEIAAGEFVRREVAVARQEGAFDIVAQGLRAGERVVTAGAQVLLSEESKSQINVGDE